jgi:hypothetical protein
MSLAARNRVRAVDFLHDDYEYVSISYYADGTRNKLGEAARTLTVRTASAKCMVGPLSSTQAFLGSTNDRIVQNQGVTEYDSIHLIFEEDTTISKGDIITDIDGKTYQVLGMSDWQTHKEAFAKYLKA